MPKLTCTFEEFKKTCFYTQYYVRIPLLNMRLDKVDFMRRGKMDFAAIETRLKSIYELHKKTIPKKT